MVVSKKEVYKNKKDLIIFTLNRIRRDTVLRNRLKGFSNRCTNSISNVKSLHVEGSFRYSK